MIIGLSLRAHQNDGRCSAILSGAISKTVNLPHSASVDDVQDLYKEAWQSGIKAVAIYRDNCKVAQPLTVDGSEGTSPAISQIYWS